MWSVSRASARSPRPCCLQKAAASVAGASPRRTLTSPVRPSPISTVMRSRIGGSLVPAGADDDGFRPPLAGVAGVFGSSFCCLAAEAPSDEPSPPAASGGMPVGAARGDEPDATSKRSCSCWRRTSSCRLRSIRCAIDWRSRSSASAMRSDSASLPPTTIVGIYLSRCGLRVLHSTKRHNRTVEGLPL